MNLTREQEKLIIAFLTERLETMPDETWDNFNRRQGLIDIIDELK